MGKDCTLKGLEYQARKARTCSVGKEAEQYLKLILHLLNSFKHFRVYKPNYIFY